MITRLLEIGRKVSKANEATLRAAMDGIRKILDSLNSDSKEAQALSYSDIIRKISDALETANPDEYCYVCDLFSDSVVYASGGDYFQAPYSVDSANAVTLGSPTEVEGQMVWTPVDMQAAVGEADSRVGFGPRGHYPLSTLKEATYLSDFSPITEIKESRALIKIIQSGWGSSGYYPADVLRRDGPQVYKKGLEMYWNHPTAAEERDRPEGDLTKLAARLEENAVWREGAPQGDGLYAWAKVYDQYAAPLSDMKSDIGVSVRGNGLARQGEIEGRQGPIFERLLRQNSVDFVTIPGAGGRIVEMFEAAVFAVKGDDPTMTEAQNKELREALDQATAATHAVTEMRNLMRTVEAEQVARGLLAGVRHPAIVDRVVSESTKTLPLMSDGKLDRVKMATQVTESLAREQSYAESIGGRVSGAGASLTTAPPEVDLEKDLVSVFRSMGMSEAMAATAAKGRA